MTSAYNVAAGRTIIEHENKKTCKGDGIMRAELKWLMLEI